MVKLSTLGGAGSRYTASECLIGGFQGLGPRVRPRGPKVPGI